MSLLFMLLVVCCMMPTLVIRTRFNLVCFQLETYWCEQGYEAKRAVERLYLRSNARCFYITPRNVQ